jgi:hypothetical protein
MHPSQCSARATMNSLLASPRPPWRIKFTTTATAEVGWAERERGASGQLQAIDRESIKKDFQSGRSDHRFHRLPNIPDEGGKYLFEHGGRKLVISVFSAERDRT